MRLFSLNLLCSPPFEAEIPATDQPTNRQSKVFSRVQATMNGSPLKSVRVGLKSTVPALRLKPWPQGSNSSLEAETPASNFSPDAQIPASRLKSYPWGSNPSFNAQIPTSGSVPCLKAQITTFWRKSPQWSLNPNLTLRRKYPPQGSSQGSNPFLWGSNFCLKVQILASKLKLQPRGSVPCYEAQISATRLKSQPQDINLISRFKSHHQSSDSTFNASRALRRSISATISTRFRRAS